MLASHTQSLRRPITVRAPIAWDVDFAITIRGDAYRAARLSPTEITLVGAAPLPPNWLVEIELCYFLEPIRVLVNVSSCEVAGGEHIVVVKPYGLGGDAKTAWLQLVAATRPQS